MFYAWISTFPRIESCCAVSVLTDKPQCQPIQLKLRKLKMLHKDNTCNQIPNHLCGNMHSGYPGYIPALWVWDAVCDWEKILKANTHRFHLMPFVKGVIFHHLFINFLLIYFVLQCWEKCTARLVRHNHFSSPFLSKESPTVCKI